MPTKDEAGFVLIKKKNLYAAYEDLNATALVLWIYFAGNKDGFDLALSPKAVEASTGMAQSTCRDQIQKLIARGYLVPKHEGSNVYNFYEFPKTVGEDNPKVIEIPEKTIVEVPPVFVF